MDFIDQLKNAMIGTTIKHEILSGTHHKTAVATHNVSWSRLHTLVWLGTGTWMANSCATWDEVWSTNANFR